MSVSHPHKSVCPASIDCGGTTTVTIGFDARAAESCPADIALVLDRSSSMCPPRLCRIKAAARQLIDHIAAPSRLGLVSFADTARRDAPLTTDKPFLHRAVENLQYGGATNHHDAFAAAETLLAPSERRKILVLFTDGATTTGPDPDPVADRLKAAGVEIYCIGLATDPAPLHRWASRPTADHVAATDDPDDLERLFLRIAAQLTTPGARDVTIREELTPDFEILSHDPPTHGSVTVTGPHTLTWMIPAAGRTPTPEAVRLRFTVRHTGTESGRFPVNHSLSYTDSLGNELAFPSPQVEITCPGGGDLLPEACPEPTIFQIPACRDAVHIQLRDTNLPSLGRIVQVDATLCHVCPGRPIAAAILLTEVDACGREHPRGMKTVAVPPQPGPGCRDVTLRCIPFVVPEALTEHPDTLCQPRRFQARVLANYTDADVCCCSGESAGL